MKPFLFILKLIVFISFFSSCSSDDAVPKPTAPIVTTFEISDITKTSALSGGSIAKDGGSPITASGVCWSTSQLPTIDNSKTNENVNNGDFTSTISPLEWGKKYYVRAYATNEIGTSYGSEKAFTTITPWSTCQTL